MADSNESFEQSGEPPDGGLRRRPQIIEGEAVEVGATVSEPISMASKASSNPSGRLQWRVIGAGFLGAGLAVAASAAVWLFLVPPGDAGLDELRARIAALELQQRANVTSPAGSGESAQPAVAKVDDLAARIARLEAAGPASSPESASGRSAAIEASLNPVIQRLDDIDRRARDSAAVARAAVERAAAAAGAVAELKKDEINQTQRQQDERSGFVSLASRINSVDAEVRSMAERLGQAAAAAADKPLRVAVVAAALRTAAERDYPFVAELAAARALGLDADALAALEPFAATGVPNPNELLRELSALVPDMLRVSAPASHEGNYLDRLQANAVKLMNIRPVGDVPGDEPATVIGRIELKMVRPDIAGVLAELDKLPAPAQEVAQAWRKKALAREAAIKSARSLATASFAKLEEAPAQDNPSR